MTEQTEENGYAFVILAVSSSANICVLAAVFHHFWCLGAFVSHRSSSLIQDSARFLCIGRPLNLTVAFCDKRGSFISQKKRGFANFNLFLVVFDALKIMPGTPS